MCRRKNYRTSNRQHAIGNNAIQVVGERGADKQQQQPGNTPTDNAFVRMAAKTDAQRNQADRQYYNQYLSVQMPLAELTKKRQHGNDDGQQQAMQQAQTRQRYGGLVEHV
jgi:hypothetical protein